MKNFPMTIALGIVTVQALWTDMELTGIQNSNGGVFKTDLKVSRFNKTTYTLSGTLEFTENLDDKYECEAKAYYSRRGNNQFTLLPYKLPRCNCCQFFESVYHKLVEKSLQTNSDMPKREGNAPLCYSYKKGVYILRPDPFSKDMIVKFVEPGAYKDFAWKTNIATKNKSHSALCKHVIESDPKHTPIWSEVDVIYQERNNKARQIKEMIAIKQTENNMNKKRTLYFYQPYNEVLGLRSHSEIDENPTPLITS